MTELAWGIVGLLFGGALGGLGTATWLAARVRAEREARIAAESRTAHLENAVASADEERLLLRQETAGLRAEIAAASARAEGLAASAAERASRLAAAEDRAAETQRALHAAERQLAAVAEQQKARDAQLIAQRELLAEAEKRLIDAFASASQKALGQNNEQFLRLAGQSFQTLLAEAKGDVEKRQQAIDATIKPVAEALAAQQRAIAELERKREGAYQGIDAMIRGVSEQQVRLQQETGRLVAALRRPEQRGRWGEMQLRNVVELAGMTAHCDFAEQVSVEGEGGRYRPDMVVRLPGGGQVVVDSKVALDAYLDALQPDADREACLARHADQVRTHVRSLAEKRYWDQFERTPRLVVLFMPLESALGAALERDPDLHARAMGQSVLIATPTLLVALLRAVAYGWRQEDVAANARQIAEAGRELHDRVAIFVDRLGKVGEQLGKATKEYNAAVGSLEARVLPSARRLRDLHATTAAEIGPMEPIELEPRALASREGEPPKEV
ncbi:MAG TPA: DNA recombination protein RmuC [Phycisphaerales bacterium]|mgnify:CR=1 FL=1|nr:DNA recombination protein RmuC [Phycisphaerales bacterium]HMP38587.1 DNA recombination protein RmuC [Phycisphaerales bacterium]